jgi:DNA-binding transcriptional LysR family regulator
VTAAAEHLNAEHDEASGIVRLRAVPSFGRLYVLPQIKRFSEQFPRVGVEITFAEPAGDSSSDEFDVGIFRGSFKSMNHVCRRLGSLRYILVASPDYLARAGSPTAPTDLRHHKCVSVRFASGEVVPWRLSSELEEGHRARNYVHHPAGRLQIVDQVDATVDAAVHGLGIAPVAETSVLEHIKNGALKRVLDDWVLREKTDVLIVHARLERLPLRIRCLSDFLFEHLRDIASSGGMDDFSRPHWRS